MISSELRIGNYVASTNFIYIIKEVGEKYVRIKGIDLDYDYNYPLCEITNLKPIPLTKEWLLKFGFDFSVDTWYLKGVAIWETECCDAKGNEEIGFFYELRDVGMMDMHIKYVHQLQNLYFALTGEELIIK